MKDKIAIVTGGANGIGFAICEALLQNEVKFVAIFDLATTNRECSGKIAASKLEQTYGKNRAGFYSCDVANTSDFTESFKKVLRTYKTIDVIVNNAGMLKDLQPERMIDVNIKGTVTGTLLAIEHLGKHRGGNGCTVVNVASIAGLMITAAFPIYSATKHAVVSFTRCMKDHADITGIRVVAICPGATLTRLGSEVPNSVLDIVTKEALDEVINLPWQRTENVGTAVIDIIKYGPSGSVWVTEDNAPPYEVPPNEDYSKMRLTITKTKLLL